MLKKSYRASIAIKLLVNDHKSFWEKYIFMCSIENVCKMGIFSYFKLYHMIPKYLLFYALLD